MAQKDYSLKQRYATAAGFAAMVAVLPFAVNQGLEVEPSVEEMTNYITAEKVRDAASRAAEAEVKAALGSDAQVRAFNISAQGRIDMVAVRAEALQRIESDKKLRMKESLTEEFLFIPLGAALGFMLPRRRQPAPEKAPS